LVWDGDVQPDGIAAGYTLKNLGPLSPFIDSVNLVAGEYMVLEQKNVNDLDAQVYQVAANKKLGDHWATTAATGFYNFRDTEKDGATKVFGHNAGNAVNDGAFDSAFRIIDTFVNLKYSGWKVPLAFSGQYFTNPGAETRRDDGFALGLSVGKAKKRGNWQVYYQYQVVGQDAVFSPISQDDWMANTNLRGHVGGLKYRLFDKVTLHLWGLLHQREDSTSSQSEQTQNRFRADVNVSF
ncbi:MAG: putative porin, partial [Candidatus Binatia bacterium]|nr:putative porin [Candidatus Binatia bacterium]